jgi:hypothetical protein
VIKVEWWALGGKKRWNLSFSSCGIFHSISPNLCGYWVQKGVSREKLPVRVRFPTKPPPPLPPDSPGLHCLGVEEEASVEVEVMADRGRGRGRGAGRGKPWMQQQQMEP